MARVAPILAFIACAIALSAFLPAPPAQAAQPADVARATGLRVLGATRGYATAALWLRASEAYRRGDLWETEAMYQLIRELQPRNPAVYSYLSWNEAYNIPNSFPDVQRQLPWLKRGLQTIHEGQQTLPKDASLRLEEWHFIFNRTRLYPFDVLRLELPHWREKEAGWALLVDDLFAREAALSERERGQLDAFNIAATLPVSLIELMERFHGLEEPQRAKLLDPAFDDLDQKTQGTLGQQFDSAERQQVRAFVVLDSSVQALLAIANWARLHLLTAALRPALEMWPRSLTVDATLLNSYLHAQRNLPPGAEVAFTQVYKSGARQAFRSGLELARQAYGEEGAKEFRERMIDNFQELANWFE